MGTLSRSLSFPFLAFYGIGMILGAGIYSVIGVASAEAGESLWLSFLLAGFVAILTGLSYAELATLYPRAGAEYVYLKEVFSRSSWLAGAVGLMVAFSGVTTAATVAVAFGGYLNQFVDMPILLSAILLIGAVGAVNIIGIKESAWVNVLFTLLELGGLGMFIWFGMRNENLLKPLSDWSGFPEAIGTTGIVIFSFFGFENMVNLAEEAKKPERNVPLAILTSLGLVTVVYVLVALALVSLIDPRSLGDSDSPLAEALRGTSAAASKSLGGIALFSTANTALIALVSTSRLLFSMGRDGQLPKVLAKTHLKRKSPWIAGGVALVIAASLVPLGSVKVLASASSFVSLLAFILVNVALIVLRVKEPRLRRPFRVPLSIGPVPIPALVAILTAMVLLTQFDFEVYALGVPMVLVSIGIVILRKKLVKA